MTVLLATHRLPANLAAFAREACAALALPAVEWTRGVPRVVPVAVISGLDHGARRIPDDLIALLEATPALRLMLCAQEMLIKPRVVLGDGRISVLSPPIDRGQIEAALREAIRPSVPPPPAAQVSRRFELLRRTHWIAWSRGRAGAPIAFDERQGATVIVGGARDPSAIAGAMTANQGDAEREAALGLLAGGSGVAHLASDASEWLLYWPEARGSLWLCSPNRMPARWDAARGIAAVPQRRLLRIPAFSGDQLIAAWSETDVADDALAPIQHLVSQGGSETMLGLDDLTGRNDQLTGLVMEVR